MYIKHSLTTQQEEGYIPLKDQHQLSIPVGGGGLQPMIMESYEYETYEYIEKQ